MLNKRQNIKFILIFIITLGISYSAYAGNEKPSHVSERISDDYYLPGTITDESSFYAPREITPSDPEKIELEYRFLEPEIKKVEKQYYSVSVRGTYKYWDEPGLPLLPIKTAKILIPQGRDVKNINIVPGRKIILDGEFKIEHSKQQIPISRPDLMVETQPNLEIYTSSTPFPGKLHSEVSTQYFRGYKILIINLFPVQWTPVPGKVSYYPDMRVVVTTTPAKPPYVPRARCRNLPSDISCVRRLIDNPAIINTYTEETTGSEETGTTTRTMGVTPLSLQGGPYEYVIITTEALKSTFQTLANHKISKGATATLVTVDDLIDGIYANYDGTRPDGGTDNQTKIRNFIIDAYNTWSTQYVLLGGDGDGGGAVIPHRGVYGKVSTAPPTKDNDIPCDLYYSALDGTWDNDGDGTYGESKDGVGGGDVDLLAEVYLGRIACDTTTEADNQINKIIAYENSTPTTNALLLGQQLDSDTWSGDYKDEVYTYFPTDWSATKLYEKTGTFSSSAVIDGMNSSQNHIVNNMGHSNNTYDMGLYNSDVDGLINTTYFLAYSQGCYSNAFDNRTTTVGSYTVDAISEHFTAENYTAAFTYIGNTRYGWYAPGSTNGASQQFDKEFFDAIFNEGKTNLGIAFQDSKEDLIGSVGSTGAMRWCYFELCLMGDPQTSIILPKPDLTLTSSDISFSNPTPSVGEVIPVSAIIHHNGIDYSGTELFLSQTTHSSNGYPVFDGQQVAQSFLVGSQDITVSKISLFLWQIDSIPGEVYLEIQTDDGGSPSGTGIGSTSNSNVIDTGKWWDFTFSTEPVLSENTTYWIVAKSNSSSIQRSGWLHNSTNPPYVDGEEMRDYGSGWESTNADATFKIYIVSPTTVEFYDGDPDLSGSLIETDYLSPIPGSGSDTASVEWTATGGSHDIYVVVDPADLITESDETNNKAYKTISVGIRLIRYDFPQDSWYMISVPLEPGDSTPEAVIGDDVGNVFYDWTLAQWQPGEEAYKYHKATCCPWSQSITSILSISPGSAYWLITRLGPFDIDAAGSLVPDSDYDIHLLPGPSPETGGWNQIGNPFNYSVDWANSQVKYGETTVDIATAQDNNWVENKIWWYSGSEYLYWPGGGLSTSQLNPWEGYWVHNFIECDLIISPAPLGGAGTQVASIDRGELPGLPTDRGDSRKPREHPLEWKIQLSVSANSQKDTYNFAGIDLAAKHGYDGLDVLEPPPISTRGVSLYFPHPDWSFNPGNYAQDIRKSDSKKEEWHFEVETHLKDTPIILRWSGLDQVKPCKLSLIDLDADRNSQRRRSKYSQNKE